MSAPTRAKAQNDFDFSRELLKTPSIAQNFWKILRIDLTTLNSYDILVV